MTQALVIMDHQTCSNSSPGGIGLEGKAGALEKEAQGIP